MKTRLRCLLVALGVLGCAHSSLGANLTWTGALSQDFYNATNWSPHGIPAGGDTLNIASGSVTISPAFTSSGQMNWSGGTIFGGLTISGGGTLAMSSANTKFLTASITNSGTVTLAGTGQVQFGNANLQIVNQSGALFDIQGDATITSAGNSGLLITNAGTFRKSAGTNSSQIIGIPVQNTGTLSALTGTLDLQSGGTLGGSWTASSSAALTFSSGNFTLLSSAVSSGAGFVGVAGNGPAFSGTLGTTLDWSGGQINGGWNISSSGTLAMSGANAKYLGASITNAGTIILAGTGQLQFANNNVQIVDKPGALFDIQGDATITWGGNPGSLITNAGTFRKSAGTNSSQIIGIPVQNTSTLSALTGTLDLQSGGTLGGNWTASSGATLTFSGGNFTLLASAVSSGAGFVGVTANSPAFTGTLGTTLDWSGGQINGGWNISSSGTLAMSGGNAKYVGGSITNAGTMILAGTGQLQFANNNVQIVNQPDALFDIQGDATITWGGNPGLLITNAGSFRKSAGTNNSQIIGIPIQNTGTLSALTGTLDLQSGGTLGGNWTASSGAALTFSSGNFTLLASAVSSGAGFVGVSGNGPAFSGTLGTTLDWSGGSIYGGWNISASGALALSGANAKYVGGSITNAGTMTLAGTGQLQFANNNLQIINQPGALFDLQGDESITSGGNGGLQIVNAGTLRKSAGTNTGSISGITCLNTGTMSALNGTLNITSAFTNSGGALAVRLNSTNNWGRFAFSSSLILNGSLQVTITNGFVPAQSNQFQLISSSALSGTFASVNVPLGTSVSYSNNSVYLLVNGALPAQLFNPVNLGGTMGVSLGTANGQSYTVQRNDDLTTTNWVFYTNFTGNGSIMQIVVPTTSPPRRFFRVREP